MFAVDDILIADEVATAPFMCNLGVCHGACCVQGDSGAPLEPEERAMLERILPRVRKYLRPEALAVLEARGPWEESGPGMYAVPCVDDAECVFVTYEGPVAKCAIQKAYHAGRIDFEKPISCHLFPLRREDYGASEVLNYEQIEICRPARKLGRRHGVRLEDFLETPLTRLYGAAWYEQFKDACAQRRAALGVTPCDR